MNKPTSLDEISACIVEHAKVAVVGARTKPRLGRPRDDTAVLSMTQFTGVTEYEPSEYTITVKAGTSVSDVVATLAERGQYLPFDPLWTKRGATIGGTIAANAAGPGRVRFGGIRDFIIGVTTVDGNGRILRTGGKVVKNAAGFDTPKFMVGSMGRWGAIAEVTFKVFPRPTHSVSRIWHCESHEEARQQIARAARSRWEPTAIEYAPAERAVTIRLSGAEQTSARLATEVGGEPGPSNDDWSDYNDFDWADINDSLVRVPVSLSAFPPVLKDLEMVSANLRVSGAGNTLWINAPADPRIDETLRQHQLVGLNYHDTADPLWWGNQTHQNIDRALQAVFDPGHRFDAFH